MKHAEQLQPPIKRDDQDVEIELRGTIDRRRPPRWIEILVDILDNAPPVDVPGRSGGRSG